MTGEADFMYLGGLDYLIAYKFVKEAKRIVARHFTKLTCQPYRCSPEHAPVLCLEITEQDYPWTALQEKKFDLFKKLWHKD